MVNYNYSTPLLFQQIWACNLCKRKQDLLAKTGQWYHGGMAKPVQLEIDPQR